MVFTQYDIPLANTPDGLVVLDGNDWAEGRATHRGYLNHDVAVAADGNVWLTAFPPPDRTLYRIDIATGQVTWYAVAGADGQGTRNLIPGAMAPRRMGADSIARIDTRTLATKLYRLPIESHPYRVAVDRHRNAWVSMMGDDWLLRLDARTEAWSLYQLPVLNCDNRYVVSDHARDEIWIPCARTSQAIRMQFRTPEQVRALREDPLPPLPPPASSAPRPAGVLPRAAPADPTVTRGVYDMRRVVRPADLTADERAGRKLFYGRRSMCHTQPSGPWIDRTTVRSRGRAFVRDKIARGSADMPGQQHSLSPQQIDQVVAYLETRTPAEQPAAEAGWW